uniref:Uncharacterized protein n=1 Tax=Arundo donax TaxID=35708 RepID=A0A0A9HC72_ARUDO
MDGDNMAAPATEPAWYDSDPNIDEDYRLFLRHACAVNDAETVFEMGDFSVTLGDDSEGEEDEEEEEEEDEEEEEEEEDEDGGRRHRGRPFWPPRAP